VNLRTGILLATYLAGIVLAFAAYRNVALEEGVTALKSEDYDVAQRKLAPLARVGDSKAQFLLGQMYAFGWGVPRDERKAFDWLRRSTRWRKAEPDKAAIAAYYIGRDYAEGVGAVRRDEREALRWFRIAAESGFREAAQRLGEAYSEGTFGLEVDPKQAAYWFAKAHTH